MLEGVCFGTKAAVDALRAATSPRGGGGEEEEEVASIAVAGGATRSEFWLQMHADVTGLAVSVGEVDNAPLLGSAILAAVGAGCFLKEAESAEASTHLQQVEAAIACMVHPARTLDPCRDRTEQYDSVYAIYSRLAAAVQSICHSLASFSHQSPPSTTTTSNSTAAAAAAAADSVLPSQRPAVIMPSILAADFGSLSREASDCYTFSSSPDCWLHVDVCDGGREWCPGALTLGPQAVAALHRDVPSLQLEAHVVSDNLEDLLLPLSEAGTSRLTFQLEQVDPSVDWTQWDSEVQGDSCQRELLVQKVRNLVMRIRSLGMTAGICIAPTTSIQYLDYILSHLGNGSHSIEQEEGDLMVDAIDILAVSPGFGGQPFNETVLHKVAFLRDRYPRLKYLEVDGGINRQTAVLAAAAGANVLIAGR